MNLGLPRAFHQLEVGICRGRRGGIRRRRMVRVWTGRTMRRNFEGWVFVVWEGVQDCCKIFDASGALRSCRSSESGQARSLVMGGWKVAFAVLSTRRLRLSQELKWRSLYYFEEIETIAGVEVLFCISTVLILHHDMIPHNAFYQHHSITHNPSTFQTFTAASAPELITLPSSVHTTPPTPP